MEASSTPSSEAITTTITSSDGPPTSGTLPSFPELRSSAPSHQAASGRRDTSHCDRCNRNFIDKESLSIHLKYYHGDLVNMWMNPTEPRDNLTLGQNEMPAVEAPLGEFGDIHISDLIAADSVVLAAAASDARSLRKDLEPKEFDSNMNDPINDHVKMITSENFRSRTEQLDMQALESKYILPNHSPSFSYNYGSPLMPSPQGNVVSAGPSSSHSNTSGTYHHNAGPYYSEYALLHASSLLPQQSPGVHPPLPSYSQSSYSGNPHLGGGENQGLSFGDPFGSHSSVSRYHPYGRSPSASPSVVKEEPKAAASSDSREILDLDTHRFLGASARPDDQQNTEGNPQLNYRPSIPQNSYSRNTSSSYVSQREPGRIISNNMFGGGTVHSQRSPPVNEMAGSHYGYVPQQASLPSYHQQSYPPAPSLPSGSSASSPSSQEGPQATSDPSPTSSDFPANVKRPKNFRCEICLKWFTSQGHLKRHYNTNIHRNMLKQKEAKDAELAKSKSLRGSPQLPTTTQSSQGTSSPGMNHYQPSPAEQGVVSPPLKSATDMDQNNISTGNSLGLESEDVKSQMNESTSPFLVQNNNISSQPTRPTPVPATSMYSSVASFQPGYSQPNFSQINTLQPQYAATPLYQADSSSLVPTSSSTTSFYGHFSTNPSPYDQASLSNNTSAGQPFFQAGSTPMTGGGFLHLSNSVSPNTLNTSNSLTSNSHRQSISPKLISPQHPSSGDYQSPEVHSTNESMTNRHEYQDIHGCVDPYSMLSNRSDNFMGQNISSTGNISDNRSSMHAVNGVPTIAEEQQPRRVPSAHYPTGSPEGMISSSSPEGNKVSETTLRSPSAGSPDSSLTNGSDGSLEPEMVDGLYKCIQCSQTFTKKCYYTQHYEKHLIGDENYKCDKCGKKYNDKKVYELHVSKHEGDKPYKCEMLPCTKQFNHKTDLRRHMCLHTGEKPFKCSQCSKGFIRKDHMVKHMQTHRRRQTAAAAETASNNPQPPMAGMPETPTLPLQYPMLQAPYGSSMLSVMPPIPGQFPPLADFPSHSNLYQHLMPQQETSVPQQQQQQQHHHHHHHEVPPYVRVDY